MIEGITKIKFNSDGFKEILMSTQGLVSSVTNEIAAKANANLAENSTGYSAEVFTGGFGGGRPVGVVASTDKASAAAEAEYKALSRAVG